MKLNREGSKFFKRIAVLGLAGLITINPSLKISDSMISVALADTSISQSTEERPDDKFFEGQIAQEARDYEYSKNVHNANLADYDQGFLDFYHNGLIYIDEKENPIKVGQLLILSKNNDDGIETHVVSYKNVNYDIFSNSDIQGFVRDYLMDFVNANCFYDFYLRCKENGYIKENTVHVNDSNRSQLIEAVNLYNMTMHDKAPETYYLRIK